MPDCTIPFPHGNKLINDELSYDRDALTIEHASLLNSLTEEQRSLYDIIVNAVEKNEGGFFFVYGYGGTGKTHLWKTLTSALRSEGEIVLTVASSGISALLLPGGRTAHSRFHIPLCVNEDSTCGIKQGSPIVDLLIRTKLIIWYEAPMVRRECFEALDQSLRDVLKFANPNSQVEPFGGKVVVLGGDFCQILPVIPRGNRSDIVYHTISSSYLWDSCRVLTLSKNMRLFASCNENDRNELEEFSRWI